MSDYCEGDKRNCDDGRDNNSGQCKAKRECVHVFIPSLSLVLFGFSLVVVFYVCPSCVFFFRDSAVITRSCVSGLVWDTSVFA